MQWSKHPKELWILGLTELCERYAFWGVGNLLVLYLIEYYHYSNSHATHFYGLFAGFSAFLPFVGGWVADRWNYQSPLFLGAIFNALGCFLLSLGVNHFLIPALFLMAIGYGLFTPSIITVLGFTYQSKPELRHAGFSIYYASINIGVFLALASLGTIAKLINWNMAFFVAGAVQVLGLVPLFIYLLKHKETYRALKAVHKESRGQKKELSREQKDRMKVIFVFCLVSLLFWLTYIQGFSSMEIFVHDYMNKTVGNISIPDGVFLSSESFFLVILAPILATLYLKLKKKNKDPSSIAKGALSLYFMAFAFLIMMIASFFIPENAKSANVSSIFVLSSYFSIAVSEMLFAPIGLSMLAHIAPRRFKALSIGIFYCSVGIAFYLGGLIAGLMDKVGGLSNFFLIFIIITLIPALFMTFTRNWLVQKSHLEKEFD